MFKPTRPDGRSYRDVAVDYIKDKPPDTIIGYDEFASVFGVDLDHRRIGAIVRGALKPLLRLHSRGLQAVPTVGYRVLQAREHMHVSNTHRSKADRAIGRAIGFLDGANRSEMNDVERKMHDGQLIIMTALRASHQHLDSRLDKLEALMKGTHTVNG
jgi:hypothetical protein